jgi:hypothetical protein
MIPWSERVNIFQIEPNAAALSEISRMATEHQKMRDAIEITLDENAHLADGDNCTLIRLKNAIKETP